MVHLGVKEYRRPLLALAIPIMVQNFLSSAVSSMDIVMLNLVGQDAISAVSLASQVTTMLFFFYYGLGTGATMLCSQYHGKGDLKAIKTVQGIAMRFSIVISILFALAAALVPNVLMKIFTNDPVLIEIGCRYFRYVSIAYVCWGITEVYLSVLRSIGRVRISMALNILAFSTNIFFNAIFIMGLFGAPKMGAAGVALGTAISRMIQLAGCFIVSAKSRDVKIEFRYLFVRNEALSKDFVTMALPATANDIVWGLAFSMYSVILGHLGSDAVAANSVVMVIRNLATVACFGMASAGGIELGALLGEKKIKEADLAARELVFLTVLSGAVGSVVILLGAPIALHFAALSPTAMGYLKWMLVINVYYVFGPAVNTTLICGVFRAGGDSKYGFKVDAIDMWGYSVPLGLIAAFVLKLPVMWVYFLMCTDEFVKWPWVIKHYRERKWLNNITREDWDR